MEALKRKPDLGQINSLELADGTKITIHRVKAAAMVQTSSIKNISDAERGLRVMAEKLRVCLPGETEFKPIVYDDLLQCFNDEELNVIAEHIVGEGIEKNV
jgi:hypothetical protein